MDVSKLEFLWTRERCTMKYDLMTMRHYGVKDLSKVHRSLGWDLDDVLIVDDVEMTAINNYGNLIKINSFVYQTDDSDLLKLISYLDKIKDINGYRAIEKRGWNNGI